MVVQVNGQIEMLKRILLEKFEVKQIFIFGSNAYGKPGEESDIDLCVITNLEDKRKIDAIREIRRALLDFVFNPIDILVYNEKEFKERAQIKSTLEYKIMTHGMRIYG